jgi:hypothetical protein
MMPDHTQTSRSLLWPTVSGSNLGSTKRWAMRAARSSRRSGWPCDRAATSCKEQGGQVHQDDPSAHEMMTTHTSADHCRRVAARVVPDSQLLPLRSPDRGSNGFDALGISLWPPVIAGGTLVIVYGRCGETSPHG